MIENWGEGHVARLHEENGVQVDRGLVRTISPLVNSFEFNSFCDYWFLSPWFQV